MGDKKIKNFILLFELAKNDIKSKYANSFLGIIWAFVMPLITIFVFWYVFQMGFKNAPVSEAPFILWFSVAYVPWIFFTDFLTSGCNCFVEYSYLVKKIKFQIGIIPAVKLVSALFVHLFFIVFIFGMMLYYKYPLSIYNIQALYYTFALAAFSLGLVYLVSSFTVFFKDMTSIVNVVVQIGFWVTPIMWNEANMSDAGVRKILAVNPIHYIVTGYRDSFIDKVWFFEHKGQTIYFWVLTAIIFAAGIVAYKKLGPFFADEV